MARKQISKFLQFKSKPKDDDDDILASPPIFSSTPISLSRKLKVVPVKKDTDDSFLDEPAIPTSTTSNKTTKSPTKLPITKEKKPHTGLKRSASASDSDDFLYHDPFNTSTDLSSSPLSSSPSTPPSKRKTELDPEAIKKLKESLEKELESIIPHLAGVWKGTIRSDLADKYKKGGKDRKGMKWNLSTGGFSEQEFDLIIDLLQHHFPQCDLHYITDVLWQEAAVKLLMERKKLGSQQKAVRILKAAELSSVDRRELRRYQSDTSLLAEVAKYQEMLDSPKSPNNSQEKKRSKSQSSSQEKPSSQERKKETYVPKPTYYQQKIDKPLADLSSFSFKKQKQDVITDTTVTIEHKTTASATTNTTNTTSPNSKKQDPPKSNKLTSNATNAKYSMNKNTTTTNIDNLTILSTSNVNGNEQCEWKPKKSKIVSENEKKS